jgi:endonuclease/exonuclease/phosphatase family metal-dependent hydrolase
MNLTDIYRIFYPAAAKYTLFSGVHGTFSKIDHILRLKASLIKYNKVEITSCVLSDHNGLKLKLKNK